MFRLKEPYEPWNIKHSDFPNHGSIEQQAKFLLNYAILAPSTFNTQPWLFSIKRNIITVYPNLSRSLKTSDNENRLLYISLGCALKNLEVAAKAFGLSAVKKYVSKSGATYVEIKLEKGKKTKGSKKMLDAIKNRLTNRNTYLPNNIPKPTINKISKTAQNNGLKLIVTQNKNIKEKIKDLAEKGDLTIWNDPKFKEEHLKWIRHNLTTQHDGMPAFTVGIPLIPSLFAKFIIRRKNFVKIQARKNRFLLSSTPYFAFILSKNHSPKTWIKVGETYQEISLISAQLGIATAILAQIAEVGDLYKETMGILKTDLRPQLFFRLGFSSKPALHSPRRKAGEVLISNERADRLFVT